MWKNSHIAQLQMPSPVGCGWTMDGQGKLTIDWIAEAMPEQLVEEMSGTALPEKPRNEKDEYVDEYEVDNIIDVVFDDEDEDQWQ